MKKLLTLLLGIPFVATFSVAVSCGKADPENTYKMLLSDVTNWVTAKNSSASDSYTLANTNANALSGDEYGRLYGDLFLTQSNYSNEYPYVGLHNENFTEWVYTLRNDATWSDYQGNLIRNITVNDFLNTAKYVLNPANTSQVVNLWLTSIKGAEDIYSEASVEGADFEEVWNRNSSNFGLKVNESLNTVTYQLVKPMNYFESLLSYSAFSPIHDDVLLDPSINDNYTKGYYSGPFLPTEYEKESLMLLDKNNNYHFADKVKINRIKAIGIKGFTTSTTRELFESNTLSDFVVSPNDKEGWDKYIGNDMQNPKHTPGMVEYQNNTGGIRTWSYFFNFLNTDYFSNDENTKKRAVEASRALQYKEVRKFISENLDRNKRAKYDSWIYDTDESLSNRLRNTYIPQTFVSAKDSESNSKKFLDMEVEALNKLNIDADESKESIQKVTIDDFKDGVDFTRNKKYGKDNLNNSEQLIKSQSKEALNLKTYLIEKDVTLKSKLSENNNSGKIILNFVDNPELKTTSGAYTTEMIENFNKIENNPLKIEIIYPTTQNEFSARLYRGYSDISFFNWGPDYEDPMTYSATVKLDGDFDFVINQQKLFKFNSASDILKSNNAKQEYEKLKNNEQNKNQYNELVVENENGISELFESRYKYSYELQEADVNLYKNNYERYTKFAELEAKTLYQDYFLLPLMGSAPAKQFQVSYSIPYRTSSYAFGTSAYNYFNIELVDYLLSYDELQAYIDSFYNNLDDIRNDISSHRDPKLWNLSN
ncbi:ABC transporter substrate-binding protein [Spiroplasma turonicum]|uniref:Oligopeptide-binding protein SarA n=1 Tax=Spiroplasma turonicum TaxID=216946 RepID=A0A0K1P7B6_9MOLU|nr:ABC transporter substrate-binding protein [Spiroplasma turonicum]AKU79797.1 oligopeptide-binding protein SarA [Spiroplasma turonicum]ALX70815.1 oligopeptide ABC transporter substrate-binding protein [Spiroplasma turonicum]